MLAEMLKIIGYHIPREQGKSGNQRQFISEKFLLGPEYGSNGNASKYPTGKKNYLFKILPLDGACLKVSWVFFQCP